MNLRLFDGEFDGKTYEPEKDRGRLRTQSQVVFDLMKDGRWRTLRSIEDETGFPQSSISARLRDFRKPKFGSHTVERSRQDQECSGTYVYRIKKGEE